jgi:peroxiredoxin
MTATRTMRPETASAETPAVPLTVEGYSVLHQMMRFRWSAWRQLKASYKTNIVDEAAAFLSTVENGASGQSALYSLLGHKG